MVFFIGCAMNTSLPTLDPNVNCDLLSSCTGVRCCVHASLLKRNYAIYFNIDHCTSSLSLQIEQVYHNQTLAGFNWGRIIIFKVWTLSILFNELASHFFLIEISFESTLHRQPLISNVFFFIFCL